MIKWAIALSLCTPQRCDLVNLYILQHNHFEMIHDLHSDSLKGCLLLFFKGKNCYDLIKKKLFIKFCCKHAKKISFWFKIRFKKSLTIFYFKKCYLSLDNARKILQWTQCISENKKKLSRIIFNNAHLNCLQFKLKS